MRRVITRIGVPLLVVVLGGGVAGWTLIRDKGKAAQTSDKIKRDWIRDPELMRLRHEWVAAYLAWTRLDGQWGSAPAESAEAQRAALHRYHDAERIYFARSRMLTGRGPS